MRTSKILSLFVLLISLSVVCTHASNLSALKKKKPTVRGIVTDTNKEPIAGVVVTDGVNFTQTDRKGYYSLNSDHNKSKFVYLSVPAEYKSTTEKALPNGYYIPLDRKKEVNECNFQLEKRAAITDEFIFIPISDPQVRNAKHLKRFQTETVPDLARTLESLQGKETYGMMLGDIVWDAMDLFDPYKEAISNLNTTMYHTIGNHDFDLQYAALNESNNPDEWGEHQFGKHFGPTDYSFNVGKVHIISMKDIDYHGQKKYEANFTPEQLEWLKQDLSYVSPGTLVLLNLHAPVANLSNRGEGNAQNAKKLFDILDNYKVHIFSGHTHFYENSIISPNIYEHNIGAACGAWWAGDVNRCGAPNGYLLVNVKGNDISWQNIINSWQLWKKRKKEEKN